MATPALNPLVEKVRAMHPGAYDDMDDAALTKAVLNKYPQYSDLAAPPLSSAPGAPPKTLNSGEGPIAQGLTSFEAQASRIPENTVRMIGAKHWPIIDAHNFHELGEDVKSLNPIVTTDKGTPNEHTDWGATAANILPAILDVRGGGIAESPAANAIRGIRSVAPSADSIPGRVVRTAAKTGIDAVTDVPVIRKIAKVGKNWDATAPKAVYPGAPEPIASELDLHPKYPGAPLPIATPEQLNPSLTSEARTLPGQISPEVIRAPEPEILRAQPIPARNGLMLPAAPEEIDPFLTKLRKMADQIQDQQPTAKPTPTEQTRAIGSRPLKINGKTVSPDADLTGAMKRYLKNLPKKNQSVQ
jgi:hypothetical protein